MPRRARVGPTKILARGGVILFWSIFFALVVTAAAWTFVGFQAHKDVADLKVVVADLEYQVDGLVDYYVQLNRFFTGADSAFFETYIDSTGHGVEVHVHWIGRDTLHVPDQSIIRFP